MDLSDRHIVITGGTSGIGRELVRRLHAGNQLAVIGRNASRLEELRSEFPGVLTFQADLALPREVEAAARWAIEPLDRIDLLINNAAVQHTPRFIDPDFELGSISEEIAVNVTALCILTARVLPAMQHSGPAAILNVNSGLALAPKTTSAVYCATKSAVDGFSRSLRYQLENTNVRVLQAFLPLVDTAMTAGRGNGKLSTEFAAGQIVRGIAKDITDHDIGKVRMLRTLMRLSPALGRRIMKRA
jgi:uncharacterized oxidoreductase